MKKIVYSFVVALMLVGTFSASVIDTKLFGEGSGPVPMCRPGANCGDVGK